VSTSGRTLDAIDSGIVAAVSNPQYVVECEQPEYRSPANRLMLFQDASKFCASPAESFRDVARRLNAFPGRCIVVVDEKHHLLGTVTDGDMRRALLEHEPDELRVVDLMKANPWSLPLSSSADEQIDFMRRRYILQLPLLDTEGCVVALKVLDPIHAPVVDDTLVVLMAGGIGTRLKPLTDEMPKPLLDVGGRPIIDHIVRRFRIDGFRKFVAAVNYKAEMISAHFASTTDANYEVDIVRESQRLGTAGALSLLSERDEKHFFVTNCDVLTNTSYRAMLDFHDQQMADITVAVVEHTVHIPYGVIETNGFSIRAQREKPNYVYFINAGFYVVSRHVAAMVPKDEYFDMPELIDLANRKNLKSVVYPVSEYWSDIGRPEDLEAARLKFA
jgi:dTDP-glucose pyrophosphorylase